MVLNTIKFSIYLLLSICFVEFGRVYAHKNVLGNNLEICSTNPMTGFTRTGKCETNRWDRGTHLFCAKVTKEFLDYTKSKGNDLSTPRSYFPGLKPGDNWCLCVFRWVQAYRDGFAPQPVLNATHHETLNYLRRYKISLNDLKQVL
jgi:uncharacterized protein (DUF2237 family)